MRTDQKYGPNTAQVERLIARVGKLDLAATRALAYAWDATDEEAVGDAIYSTVSAVWDEPTKMVLDQARWAALNRAGRDIVAGTPFAHLASASEALWYATVALVLQDLASPDDVVTLVTPVASVLGCFWEEEQ